ncbi:MAG: YdeI/OmpD-associated family protein [Blastocatellia bacterium]
MPPRGNYGFNIKRAGELIEEGLIQPAGVKAFEARKENRSGIYSYEQRPASLDGLYEKKFRQNKAAWAFFQMLPPSYRKKVTWWVLSAKTEETRLKRLVKLIEDCAQGRRL